MADLKKSDYVVTRGIEKVEVKRGVRINDATSSLTVVLVKNFKKGHYHLEPKLNHNQITGDEELDADTLKVLSQLSMAAIKLGKEFKAEWDKMNAAEPSDDDQLEFGLKSE